MVGFSMPTIPVGQTLLGRYRNRGLASLLMINHQYPPLPCTRLRMYRLADSSRLRRRRTQVGIGPMYKCNRRGERHSASLAQRGGYVLEGAITSELRLDSDQPLVR